MATLARCLWFAPALIIAACGPTEPSPVLRQRLVADIGQALEEQAFATGVDFTRWLDLVERHRADLDRADTHASISAALNAALQEFGVSHLSLLTPQERADRAAGTRLGAGLIAESVPGGLLVCSVIEDGPAARAGLRAGDLLTSVAASPARSTSQLSGLPGESRDIEWTRDGNLVAGNMTLQTHRRASPDRLTWVAGADGNVAIIAIHSFADGLYDRALIDRLFDEAHSAAAILIDLRSNKGGNAANVEHLLGQVVALTTAPFTDIYREDADTWRAANTGRSPSALDIVTEVAPQGRSVSVPANATIFTGPLAVLIDSQCGSGGELTPAALQRLGRANIVGTRSRGRVRIGKNIEIAGGYELQIPIGEFVAPDGTSIEGAGVIPDVELPALETARDEVIIPRAVAALQP